MIKAEGLKTS